MANDPAFWALANPALGIRISSEYIANEQRAFASNVKGFAIERLGAGDWPRTDPGPEHLITSDQWNACLDVNSKPADPVCFAFDVSPDRSWASIAVAGNRDDGLVHVEVVDRQRGTAWVAKRISELKAAHRPSAILCDAAGPAKSLLPKFEELGIEVITVASREHGQACGIFYDAVVDTGTLRHLGTPELSAAVDGAATRPLGEAWAWARKPSLVDISPLVACTLALWGVVTQKYGEMVWDLNEIAERLRKEGTTEPIVQVDDEQAKPSEPVPTEPGKPKFIPLKDFYGIS